MQFSKWKVWIAFVLLFAAGVAVQAQPEINIKQIDANNFPFIYLVANVNENGSPIATLTTADFIVSEDGRIQTDFFEVTPPNSGDGVRLVDFVFLIDNSGSMGGEISAVRNNVNAFADLMAASGIDLRLGAVRFGNRNGSNPDIFNSGNLTGDLSVFHSWINSMSAYGGYEPGLQAIINAVNTFNFRPGSQRHFLIITDEDSDAGSLSQAVSLCNSNNVVVHGAINCGFGNSYNDYCRPNTSITGATGGLVFSVVGPYDAILDEIGHSLANTYIVRYKTDNPVYDGQQREVLLEVTTPSGVDNDIAYYTPGAGPLIIRTQPTIDLSYNTPIDGQLLTIEVSVTDDVPPGVTAVRLYYKKLSSSGYSSVIMNNIGGNFYSAQIPASIVTSPGVQYYITATDGQLTSTDPTVEPGVNPYYIAVLPNIAPVITHTPIAEADLNKDLPINAQVHDMTNAVATVECFYRKTGTLIYQNLPMANIGAENYSCTIPGVVITEDGLDYYIKATDDLGIVSIDGVHSIKVKSKLGPDIPEGDTDGDGLLDRWEILGYDYNGDGIIDVDLPAMGANPMHKDIFVEIDWMGEDCFVGSLGCHDHEPNQAAIDEIVQSFADAPVDNPDHISGINLHVDISNEIDHDDDLGSSQGNIYYWNDFWDLRETNFSVERRRIFHYCIFAHGLGGLGSVSGISRGIPGTAFIVSLGSGSWTDHRGSQNEQAGTFMHELGHNLGLHHGGGEGDDVIWKPNYLSIMNYSFQTEGLIVNNSGGHFDYSRFVLSDLVESNLNEMNGLNGGSQIQNYGTKWFCGTNENSTFNANSHIDWNCDKVIASGVSSNINKDDFNDSVTRINTLSSFNDWDHIIFDGGGRIGPIGTTVGTIVEEPGTTEVEELTIDIVKTLKPLPPYSVQGSGHLGFIEITWDSVGIEEDTLIKFNVYRDSSILDTVLGHTFFDSLVISNVSYVYNIATLNQYGVESDLSTPVIITTLSKFNWIFPPLFPFPRANVYRIWEQDRFLPIRFVLTDERGNLIIDDIATIQMQKYENDTPIGNIIDCIDVDSSITNNIARYEPLLQQYIFNLQVSNYLTLGRWMIDRKSTRLNSSHTDISRMPSSA